MAEFHDPAYVPHLREKLVMALYEGCVVVRDGGHPMEVAEAIATALDAYLEAKSANGSAKS